MLPNMNQMTQINVCGKCGEQWIQAHVCPPPNPVTRFADDATIAHMVKQDGEIIRLKNEIAALRARIDALMLEHCPNEMTEDQMAEWAKHQAPVSDEEQALLDAVLPPKKSTPNANVTDLAPGKDKQ